MPLRLNTKLTRSACAWKRDDEGNWQTGCGGMFVLDEGTPADNSMAFCCYCGKPLTGPNVKDEPQGISSFEKSDRVMPCRFDPLVIFLRGGLLPLKILVACEYSGTVRDVFTALGHDAMSCDILPSETPGKHYQGDVRDILYSGFDMLIAHPPCTYLTVTGNKWFKPEFKDRFPNRDEQRRDAIAFFLMFAEAPIERIAIENPVGIMSSLWRKPDQIIQPYEFGHTEAKKTCLWLKNLPCLMPGLPLFRPELIKEPEYVTFASGKRMAKWYVDAASKSDRAKIRSKTFEGIAQAMGEQWGHLAVGCSPAKI